MGYCRPFFWCYRVPPENDPAKLCPDFETKKLVHRKRDHTIRFLVRELRGDDGPEIIEDIFDDDFQPLNPSDWEGNYHFDKRRAEPKETKEVRALVRLLKSCKPKRECGSGACPVCNRQFRRYYVSEVMKLAGPGTRLLLFTYAPGLRIKAEDLTVERLHTLKRTLLRQLRRKCSETTQAVGWVDLKIRLTGFFEPHIHLIVFGCTEDELKAAEPRTMMEGRKAHPMKRKGKAVVPWDVRSIQPGTEHWTVAYTVRQFPKRGEAFFSSSAFRDRYDPLELQHLLFKSRCEKEDRMVFLRVERKSGVRLRNNRSYVKV